MKNLLIILVLMSAVSCTKSINEPDAPFSDFGITNGNYPPTPGDDSLTRNLGNGVILKVGLKPIMICDAGDSSKPCSTFVNIACTLSKPVNKYVQVEIIYSNMVNQDKNTSAAVPQTSIQISLAPNMQEVNFTSKIEVLSNAKINEEQFRIGKVTVFERKE